MLGNLTIEEMEKRTGIPFPEDLKKLLELTHQNHATNIGENEWHCFDIPFVLVCGGMSLAQTIYNYLKEQTDKFKEPLQIAIK